MNYVAKSIAIDRLDDDEDMVWHDAPCEHAIALTVEVQDGILDQLCDGWFTQPARTKATIQPFIGLGQIIWQLGESFGNGSRKAIEQPKGDELNRFG
jgi:hypothetical protein